MSQNTPDPNEVARDNLEDAQREASGLVSRLSFSDELASLARHEKSLSEGLASLQKLRSRNYVWRPDLEEKVEQARAALEPARRLAREEADQASRDLRRRVDALLDQGRELARRGNFARNKTAIDGYEREVDGIGDAIRAAEERVQAAIAPVADPVGALSGALKDLHWTMDQLDGATFKLGADEHLVACAQVTWEDGPSGKCKGNLFFTDHRVRFERNEEVTTKSFLFFSTEKKKVQEVLIDEPVGHLAASDDSTRGWVMKDQLLTFSWAPGAKCPKKTTFELESGTASEWDKTVEILRSGDMSSFRAKGQARDLDAVRWPDRCSACGAELPPAVKGQTVLVCSYCHQEHSPKS